MAPFCLAAPNAAAWEEAKAEVAPRLLAVAALCASTAAVLPAQCGGRAAAGMGWGGGEGLLISSDICHERSVRLHAFVCRHSSTASQLDLIPPAKQ